MNQMRLTKLGRVFWAAVFSFCWLGMQAGSAPEKCQDWQWRISVPFSNGANRQVGCQPYLWIPPTCRKIDAVMVMSTAVLEQTVAEHPAIRQVCARHNVAIMWSRERYSPTKDSAFAAIENALRRFAELSGYSELATVPWIPVGHSATVETIVHLVRTHPKRMAAVILNKSRPSFGDANTVPALVTNGEYMEWNSYEVDLKEKNRSDRTMAAIYTANAKAPQLISFFSDPNTGHFDSRKELLDNMALYLDEVLALRFDSGGKMRAVAPADGWVVELPLPGFGGFAPVSYASATAAQQKAPWFPTRAAAQAAYDMANVSMAREAQIAGFCDASGSYEQGWYRAIMYTLPFVWNEDRSVIAIRTTPYYRMPQGEYKKAAQNKTGKGPGLIDDPRPYSFFNIGDRFENSGNPIDVVVVSGNLRKLDRDHFEYIPRFNSTGSYLIARQEGNDRFRASVQPGLFTYADWKTGAANEIAFGEIPDQSLADVKPIPLHATASSGLKARYFVAYGPARIEQDNLLLIEKDIIPPRTRFPIEIGVTAFQLGSESGNVKSAEPVFRAFKLLGTSSKNEKMSAP